jgi:hypothetical protein
MPPPSAPRVRPRHFIASRWSLSDGQRVPDSVARMVIGYTDVIDVGDTLLTGTLSQTWRFAAVCECHSITFYEVMI